MTELIKFLFGEPAGGWIFGFIMALVVITGLVYIIQAMYRGKLYSTRQIDKILEYIKQTLREFND